MGNLLPRASDLRSDSSDSAGSASACSNTDRRERAMTMHPCHSRPMSMRLAKDTPIPEVIT